MTLNSGDAVTCDRIKCRYCAWAVAKSRPGRENYSPWPALETHLVDAHGIETEVSDDSEDR